MLHIIWYKGSSFFFSDSEILLTYKQFDTDSSVFDTDITVSWLSICATADYTLCSPKSFNRCASLQFLNCSESWSKSLSSDEPQSSVSEFRPPALLDFWRKTSRRDLAFEEVGFRRRHLLRVFLLGVLRPKSFLVSFRSAIMYSVKPQGKSTEICIWRKGSV